MIFLKLIFMDSSSYHELVEYLSNKILPFLLLGGSKFLKANFKKNAQLFRLDVNNHLVKVI